jgi:probable HAF family extracellular repeat protein
MSSKRYVPSVIIFTVLASILSIASAEGAKSFKHASGPLQITITDLGLLPSGTSSSGSAINNEPIIVGLANDANFALQRPLWNANTGAIVGMVENMSPASTAIPEHISDRREMAGTEAYGDNVYQGVYWNPVGQAFALPGMAGVDPFYGGLHTRAHGINNLGQLVGTGKEAEPNFYTHAVLWPNKDTEATDLGFLGPGTPLNYSEALGVNDMTHVVGKSAVGSQIRGFLWRNGQMTDLGALNGQTVSEAYAINNNGLIAGKSNLYPVTWKYAIANPTSSPTIKQLPIPSGFFSATPTAVNDAGDVVGYAGSPNIDAHAVLWRNGVAIDLGIWPGGHYSVARGINNLGQIVGTGTVAGDNLDHALTWTVDDGTVSVDPVAVDGLMLTSVQPNPSSSQTTLSFALKQAEKVKIGIYDLTGRAIAVLSDHEFPIGPHTLTWNGRDSRGGKVRSGIYVVRFETESRLEMKKMTLIR